MAIKSDADMPRLWVDILIVVYLGGRKLESGQHPSFRPVLSDERERLADPLV